MIPKPLFPEGNYRWRICALLFFATTINYIDRQVLGILAPHLTELFGWSEADYGFIVSVFQIAYALGLSLTGFFLDKIGSRLGYLVAMLLWSLAGAMHALASTVFGFAAARFGLGLGEAANFPAAIKTVGEWFPPKERALATGIFNAGSNVGALIAPIIVPIIVLNYSWEWAFIITGLIGFLWVGFWWKMYRRPEDHPRLSLQEKTHIIADQPTEASGKPPLSIKEIIGNRAAWGIFAMRFVSDPTWWFLLFWVPKFLNTTQGVLLEDMALPLIIIYGVADVGSVAGGWLSSKFIAMGKSVDFARKMAILIAACCVPPIIFTVYVEDIWVVVGLISLAAAAHQAYAANMFTIISDIFPGNAVGKMVGFSGTVSSISAAGIAVVVGLILDATGSYQLVFLICAFNYLIGLGLFHLFVPKIEPLSLEHAEERTV